MMSTILKGKNLNSFLIREESYAYPVAEHFQTISENLRLPPSTSGCYNVLCLVPQEGYLHSVHFHELPRTSKVDTGQEENTFPRIKAFHCAALYTMITIKRHYINPSTKNTGPRNIDNFSISTGEGKLL